MRRAPRAPHRRVGTNLAAAARKRRDENGAIRPFSGETSLFITPGYRFRAVDLLMTNFHLPPLDPVHAGLGFSGLDVMKRAYAARDRGGAIASIPTGRVPAIGARRVDGDDRIFLSTAAYRRRSPVRARSPRRAEKSAAGLHAGRHPGHAQGVHWHEVREAGADIVARQHLSPDAAAGPRAHRRARRLARFINWPHPILTDSGGFQIMSLAICARSTRTA